MPRSSPRWPRRCARSQACALLDYSSDPRTTARYSPSSATQQASEQAVLALFERAVAAIDLRTHTGEHPAPRRGRRRPVRADRGRHDGRLRRAREARRRRRRRTIRRAGLPIRRSLDQPGAEEPRGYPSRRVRGAGGQDGDRRLGARLRPRCPASDAPAPRSIGARMPLIAYNINLATDRLDVAKKIAAAIRHSSGGFRFVKARASSSKTAASSRCR